MQFIDSIVPPGGNVTTTVNDLKFSFQNVLQFYLGNDRTIISLPGNRPQTGGLYPGPPYIRHGDGRFSTQRHPHLQVLHPLPIHGQRIRLVFTFRTITPPVPTPP